MYYRLMIMIVNMTKMDLRFQMQEKLLFKPHLTSFKLISFRNYNLQIGEFGTAVVLVFMNTCY